MKELEQYFKTLNQVQEMYNQLITDMLKLMEELTKMNKAIVTHIPNLKNLIQ